MLIIANKVNKMYVSSRIAVKRLGVHANTLRRWADDKKIKYIRTASGQRKYDVDTYLGLHTKATEVVYCRVSSYKQKNDLQRQVEFMQNKYYDAEVIKDIGSGINFKRKGLKAILERAMQGERITLIIAHKDRLARFGFDLIQWVIERSGGKIVVLDKSVFSPEQELTKDLLSILHVFSARLHGLRSYKDKIKQDISDNKTKEDIEKVD